MTLVNIKGSDQMYNDPREWIDDHCSSNYSRRDLYERWVATKTMVTDHKVVVKALRPSVMDT